MRTRSPSMKARGMTATSGRQSRSCDGAMVSHHATTPRNTTSTKAGMRLRRDSQNPQMANAANAAASASRRFAHGKFE